MLRLGFEAPQEKADCACLRALPRLRARQGGRNNVAHGESRGEEGKHLYLLSPGRGDITRLDRQDLSVATAVAHFSRLRDPTAYAVGHIISPLKRLQRRQNSLRSTEVFGSETNSSAVLSHCRAMNRLRLGFEVRRRKATCAYLHATPLY